MSADIAVLLGVPETSVPATLSGMVGTPVAAGEAVAEAVPYAFGSPTTGGLWRVRGAGWSLFVKQLQHARHWPGLAMMPPEIARTFAAELPWRTETELWDPRVQASLPDGLRSPTLHRLVELPDDRLALWQEDVQHTPHSGDLDQFGRAAFRLGQWNARSMAPEVLAVTGYPPGFALRMYAERSVPMRGLGPLRDDGLWQHPWLAGHTELRHGLLELAPHIPAMLDRLDATPQTLPHGDASPQNLLKPLDGSADFVVIDLSFRTPHALGFDLGQLLVGLTHAGELPAATLPHVSDVIVPAYLNGLATEGVTGLDAQVRESFATAALLRSGFDGFRYDLLDQDTDEAHTAFTERLTMAAFLVAEYHRRRA